MNNDLNKTIQGQTNLNQTYPGLGQQTSPGTISDPWSQWRQSSLPYIVTTNTTNGDKPKEVEHSIDIENVEVTQTFINELIKIVTDNNVDLYLKGVTIKKETKEKLSVAYDKSNNVTLTMNKHIHSDELDKKVVGKNDVVEDPLADVLNYDDKDFGFDKVADPLNEVPTEAYQQPIVKGKSLNQQKPSSKETEMLDRKSYEDKLYRAKERELFLEKRIEQLSLVIHDAKVTVEDPLEYKLNTTEETQELIQHDLKTK